MKNFTFGGAKYFLGVPRGAEWPDFKKSKNPYTKRWSQPTAKIFSILAELESVYKSGTFGGVSGPSRVGRVARFKKIEKSLYRTMVSTHSQSFSILAELESV